jgi:glycosyltransferase involved in cell wall biosynthesis
VPVYFRGWALEGLNPVVGAEIVLDNRERVPVQLGLHRPDVPVGENKPCASEYAGWGGSVDLSTWPAPEVHVQVIVRGVSGREAVLLDRLFRLRSDQFAGYIDVPVTTVGPVFTVRGMAAVSGRGPSIVEIEVDGVRVGRARLRIPRADPYGQFGFEYAGVLDDDAGTPHTVGAVVSGMDGSRFRMSDVAINVTVPSTTEVDAQQAAILRATTREEVGAATRSMSSISPDEKIRLLVFTHQLDLGGGQLYLQELLRQLMPMLESCTVVSLLGGVLRTELELLGAHVVVTGNIPPDDVVAYEDQVRELSMLILESSCHVVLVNTLVGFPAVDAAVGMHISTVWAIHESFELDYWLAMFFGHRRPHPYVRERMKASLKAASRLVFEAQATSDIFAAYADQDRRLVVPYGVDIHAIIEYMAAFNRSVARARQGFEPDTIVLLCVGTVEERKSQACLVEAFAEVVLDHPNATLVLVGDQPGPYSAALHRQIALLGLGDRLRLLPTTKDIWEWYAQSDVLISASDVESLPRSMLEAMAFGLPVLSADVFGVPEVIQDGECGWLFEARDMRSLVKALHRVLDLSPDERQTVSLAARTLAHHQYHSSNYGNSYAELFRELTSVSAESADSTAQSNGVRYERPL